MPKRNGILAALGLNVRRAREAKQLTQEKLSERDNLDPPTSRGAFELPEFRAKGRKLASRVRAGETR